MWQSLKICRKQASGLCLLAGSQQLLSFAHGGVRSVLKGRVAGIQSALGEPSQDNEGGLENLKYKAYDRNLEKCNPRGKKVMGVRN